MDINFDKNEKDKNEERNRYIAMTGSQENRYRIIENENNQNSEFSENFFVHKKNREASDDIDKKRNEAVAKNGYSLSIEHLAELVSDPCSEVRNMAMRRLYARCR